MEVGLKGPQTQHRKGRAAEGHGGAAAGNSNSCHGAAAAAAG